MTHQKLINENNFEIVYTYIPNKAPCIVYLHGLCSSRNSAKGKRLAQFASEKGFSFLAVDYTAHGESGGVPSDFRVHRCLNDVLSVIKAENITQPLYLVGSSLGGWIAFLLAEQLSHQVKGVLTLAAGVDFLPVVWEQVFDDPIRTLLKQGVVIGPSAETNGYCFSYPMFTEAEEYLLLKRRIHYTGPVILAHGDQDNIISYSNSFKIKDALESAAVDVHIIKGEGHALLSYPLEEVLNFLIQKGTKNAETNFIQS